MVYFRTKLHTLLQWSITYRNKTESKANTRKVAMSLFYILQKLHMYQRSIVIHHFRILHYAALVFLLHHKFFTLSNVIMVHIERNYKV
jgi:hypothetical protein